MDAPPPNWYADPQRDGYLRWWDGARWTEHVQPARLVGKSVLGQEVSGGLGRVTFYGPGEPETHAFPPITDERYAGSPLAAALAAQVRADRSSGDVQVPAAHQYAVEAFHQLRKKEGPVGAVAGISEQLIADTFLQAPIDGARPAPGGTPQPTGWMAGPAGGSSVPGAGTPAGARAYRAAGTTVRRVLGVWAVARMIALVAAGLLLAVVGLALAIAGPELGPLPWVLVAAGVLLIGLTVWDGASRLRR